MRLLERTSRRRAMRATTALRFLGAAALGALLGGATTSRAAQSNVFVPVSPCRIVDTRMPAPGAPITPSTPRNFNVVGVSDYSAQGGAAAGCSIPGFAAAGVPTVTAVAVNVTAVSPSAQGNLLVYPTNTTPGTSSTVNFPAPSVSLNIANGAIVPVRSDAQGPDITVKTSQTTHLVIDITGYFTPLPIRSELDLDSPNIIGGHAGNVAAGRGVTIAGGGRSSALQDAAGNFATISGGAGNRIGGDWAAIGGGESNVASSLYGTVGGGSLNTAGSQTYATVAGGNGNVAEGAWSTVTGGVSNTASGAYSTVCGGSSNTAAGAYSFAAGHRARANADGAFVWADGVDQDFSTTVANAFNVRATGGAFFISGVNASGGTLSGVALFPHSGTWSSLSDRSVKEAIHPVDGPTILARLADVPIHEWSYATEDPSIRHVGPMAQDFRKAFAVGENERLISSIDSDGVAMAATQELYKLVRENLRTLEKSRKRLREKDEQIAEISKRLRATTAAIEALEKQRPGAPSNVAGVGSH